MTVIRRIIHWQEPEKDVDVIQPIQLLTPSDTLFILQEDFYGNLFRLYRPDVNKTVIPREPQTERIKSLC